MINPIEATIERLNTAAFIDADPFDCVLSPATYESNGSGGQRRVASPDRSPQRMRLIPTTGQATERQTSDGRAVQPDFMLMAPFDAVVERWDRFVFNGNRFEVLHVQEKREYQTKSEVVLLGSA